MHSATRKPGFNSCWPAWGALALVWLSVPALCQQDPAQKTVPPGNAQGKGEKPAAPSPQKPPEKPPSEPPKEPEKLQLETRSEEHTSELQSRLHLVCRLLLEKKKKKKKKIISIHRCRN